MVFDDLINYLKSRTRKHHESEKDCGSNDSPCHPKNACETSIRLVGMCHEHTERQPGVRDTHRPRYFT